MDYIVKKYQFKKGDKIWDNLDTLAFKAKNIYNKSNYYIRQKFFKQEETSSTELYYYIKNEDEYKEFPRKISKSIINNLIKDWSNYYKAIKAYFKDKTKFKEEPRIPRYKDKLKGRKDIVFDIQTISKKYLKKNVLKISGTDILLKLEDNRNIKEIHLTPKTGCYEIIIVYKYQQKENKKENKNIIGIDPGVNNLAALTSNVIGFKPILINGRLLKSVNHFYNKKVSELKSKLPKDLYTSKRIQKLSLKRNNKINDIMHKLSKYIISVCNYYNISKIVIGHNKDWKQDVNLGKVVNQNFVFIPFNKFSWMLEYKGEIDGIEVIETNESYTSKCSFLDNEKLCHHDEYKGKRIKRGLFRSKNNILINADVNGSLNTIRKVFPMAFGKAERDGIMGTGDPVLYNYITDKVFNYAV